jgi:hypothetical protein
MSKLKNRFWPDINDYSVWGPTPPRGVLATKLLPLITQLLDELTGQKVASTYLALVCNQRAGVVWTRGGEELLAFESGYQGPQARNTWRKRMQALVDAGFILVHKGTTGPMHFSLVLDPIPLVAKLIENEPEDLSEAGKQYLEELDLRFLELDIDPFAPKNANGAKMITTKQFDTLAKKATDTVDELKASTGPSDAVVTGGDTA